ncbi:hypothetical protein U9M48_014079 [Paspalum notatum var. saurae]|uniref:Transposase n=1 Tax=Paspalum notatum var. saurae TaxID=547442 RepID=A0AAQ3T0I8_PASNO
MQLIGDVLPQPHKLPNDMYQCKRLTKALGMGYEKIDMCPDGCMLFCDDHVYKKKCLKCGKGRYVKVVNEDGDHVTTHVAQKQLRSFPMAPRFKRLFLSMKTCESMRWSKEGVRDNPGFIRHPADSDAWKALDEFKRLFLSMKTCESMRWSKEGVRDNPGFIGHPADSDARNICFGLATDGFTPFGQSAASYSCWPVFVIPYNLPPHMCMKYEFMFFCLIILDPEYPGPKINVMLQPLIKELKQLWYGVEAYDISLKAAYLWSVHDFMAYGIFAGWSVHGTLTCPICGVDTRCFCLEFGGKICYFDCHRCWLPSNHIFRGEKDSFRKDTICYEGPPKRLSAKEILDQLASLKLNEEKTAYEGFGKEHNWTHISGIWDLPHAKALKLPHNIDVMHQERNVAESIISTCMDFSDKTKDNVKARKDLAKICKRPTLELTASGGKLRAPEERSVEMDEKLKFLDGYAAGLKRAVNLKTGKLNGLKAHDYHIIIERLMHVMFRGYLPDGVWSVLAELTISIDSFVLKRSRKR